MPVVAARNRFGALLYESHTRKRFPGASVDVWKIEGPHKLRLCDGCHRVRPIRWAAVAVADPRPACSKQCAVKMVPQMIETRYYSQIKAALLYG